MHVYGSFYSFDDKIYASNDSFETSSRPVRFPGIVGNAGNHENDGKFHKSHKILKQI